MTFVPSEAAGPPRVAYAVGRGVGRAVDRNRLRRRLRAAVRRAEKDLAPGAYLVGASAEAASLSAEELWATVGDAVRAATGDR